MKKQQRRTVIAKKERKTYYLCRKFSTRTDNLGTPVPSPQTQPLSKYFILIIFVDTYIIFVQFVKKKTQKFWSK